MARFDVYRLARRGEARFVVDVQADLLDELGTRIVVPLLAQKVAPKPAKRLNPVFTIDDQSFVMMTQFMAAVPERDLKKGVTSLSLYQDEITQAIDLLLTGF
ncbi:MULTISPECIES: CcdB family protein [Acetobacter]|uniref:Toxin CcdB n=2 Tax=Acetobacter TaxID=434 RepID=A0A2G4REH4_9PROT|nr:MULTISPECIES: CcdB family protein [Acetobacter]AXN01866.1 plasmid maintenance protein CcdB [Acetobacter pomorum]KAA8394693.1 plasmid maintenance protein CcdB [Acetobacter sp. DmW_125128]KAA8397345.1 plasmid maintenance protein CcdB [Acetobacter sp. DmW_125127]KAA8400329.1 plasmid maintenance protein CcdB [Acetobacter sp. DmW_125124]KAA8401787.1 plasmid maintenance protein CcdB [Acetobacter sp. DmW_125134]